MLSSSNKRIKKRALVEQEVAVGTHINRIGALLLEKRSLETKCSIDCNFVCSDNNLIIASKRRKTQNDMRRNESRFIAIDGTVSFDNDEVWHIGIQSNMKPYAGSLHSLNVICPSTSAYTFCSVPGRLSLLCASSKYKVSVAELARRLSPPESLNSSLLGGLLRRAKSKNGGQTLREQLEAIGLKLPAGRKKSGNITLLTSLVEGEAEHLAKDFANACLTEFPAKLIAQLEMKKCDTMSNVELEKEKERFQTAKQLLLGFMDILRQDTTLLLANNGSKIQISMERFSLITHTFGTPAILAGLSTFLVYIQESLNILSHRSEVTAF
ncbi:unnamed protein product [Thelazia callipaeda]|uniref:TF_AP-2 domain-containing protein n=1 Tax=Thelazia callipaeda TaxID=103827 RepID=A0A0N5D2J8_THECL|nr:unnamed protein product [Thelazia callipaeda]